MFDKSDRLVDDLPVTVLARPAGRGDLVSELLRVAGMISAAEAGLLNAH